MYVLDLIQHIVYTNPGSLQAQSRARYSRQHAPIGKFAQNSTGQDVQWRCDKLRVPTNLPPTGSMDGCNLFAVAYSIKVYMFGSGTAKNASITFNITVGNDTGVPQSGASSHTANEEWYDHTIAIDLNQSFSPFYLGGATGRDPLATASFTESMAYPTSPPLTPLTTGHSMPTESNALVPPPSYEELFLFPTHGSQSDDEQTRNSSTP